MTAKISELKEAFNQFDERWRKYEKDAEAFVRDFRQQLADYLGCDARDIQLLSVSENVKDENANYCKTSFNCKMWLDCDAYWHFTLRIVLEWRPSMSRTNEEVENKWFRLGFKVKPLGEDAFVASITPDTPQVSVTENDFSELAENTFQAVLEYLKKEFDMFVRGESRKHHMGFVMSGGDTS